MATVSRQIKWISSGRKENAAELEALQQRMSEFYTKNGSYYVNIDYTASAWTDDYMFREIASNIASPGLILEVGCGRANVLKAYGHLAARYTGVDFSEALMASNAARFPAARFVQLRDPKRLPFADRTFDQLFCTYVIEHCVFPKIFIHECMRVLRPGGLLLLVCPDFLGAGRMASQRAGYSVAPGRDKLRHGRIWDAIVTGFDRKIRIPLAAYRARRAAQLGTGGFWVNVEPTCFEDKFYPDADAVYLTYEWEIVHELRQIGARIEKSVVQDSRIFVMARRGETAS